MRKQNKKSLELLTDNTQYVAKKDCTSIHYETLKRNGTIYYFNKGGGKYGKSSTRQRY